MRDKGNSQHLFYVTPRQTVLLCTCLPCVLRLVSGIQSQPFTCICGWLTSHLLINDVKLTILQRKQSAFFISKLKNTRTKGKMKGDTSDSSVIQFNSIGNKAKYICHKLKKRRIQKEPASQKCYTWRQSVPVWHSPASSSHKNSCPWWGSNSQPRHGSAANTVYKYRALTDCATGAHTHYRLQSYQNCNHFPYTLVSAQLLELLNASTIL